MTEDERVGLMVGGLVVVGLGGYLVYRQVRNAPPVINGHSYASWLTECNTLITQANGYTYSLQQQQQHPNQHLPCVKVIQYLLRQQGYTYVAVTGKFDANTDQAVRAFQTKMAITPVVMGQVAQNSTNHTWQYLVQVPQGG